MISLILPYWERQAAADRALALIERQYDGLNLEVLVVDDGSPEPFIPPPRGEVEVRVIRLPTKQHAAATCVPWNRGVEASSGEVIALSCVEILHTNPVLEELAATLVDYDYVSPAVWCPSQSRWHVHSSLGKPPLNFLMLMRRSLFDRTGGFDEEYREGIAFEDADFSMKLQMAGARYTIRDDLVVEHPREGAKASYTPEQHARNRLLFENKWRVPLNAHR